MPDSQGLPKWFRVYSVFANNSGAGGNDALVFNAQSRVYTSMSCTVDNPTLHALFPKISTLNIMRSLQPSLSPVPNTTSFGDAGTVFAQLFYDGVEQFYCQANSCTQDIPSSSPGASNWTCSNLQCNCIPNATFCSGTTDLTKAINTLGGTHILHVALSTTLRIPQLAISNNPLYDLYLGQTDLASMDAYSAKCIRQNIIDSAVDSTTSSSKNSKSLSSGVIAGLAVFGGFILLSRGTRLRSLSYVIQGAGSLSVHRRRKGPQNDDKVIFDSVSGRVRPGPILDFVFLPIQPPGEFQILYLTTVVVPRAPVDIAETTDNPKPNDDHPKSTVLEALGHNLTSTQPVVSPHRSLHQVRRFVSERPEFESPVLGALGHKVNPNPFGRVYLGSPLSVALGVGCRPSADMSCASQTGSLDSSVRGRQSPAVMPRTSDDDHASQTDSLDSSVRGRQSPAVMPRTSDDDHASQTDSLDSSVRGRQSPAVMPRTSDDDHASQTGSPVSQPETEGCQSPVAIVVMPRTPEEQDLGVPVNVEPGVGGLPPAHPNEITIIFIQWDYYGHKYLRRSSATVHTSCALEDVRNYVGACRFIESNGIIYDIPSRLPWNYIESRINGGVSLIDIYKQPASPRNRIYRGLAILLGFLLFIFCLVYAATRKTSPVEKVVLALATPILVTLTIQLLHTPFSPHRLLFFLRDYNPFNIAYYTLPTFG